MGLKTNRPVAPIMSSKSLSRSKAAQINGTGLSQLFKPVGKNSSKVNRVKTSKLKTVHRLAGKDLFKF